MCSGAGAADVLYEKGNFRNGCGTLGFHYADWNFCVADCLRLYEKLGKFCGAGTIVPITGFANSVVSPAIEFKKEGMVFGMAAKMFIVAGPVIVYGTLTSMAVGLIYYLVRVV